MENRSVPSSFRLSLFFGLLKCSTSFIPKGTGITITPYVIHRDTRYFSPRPDEFWPERWYTTTSKTLPASKEKEKEEELVLDRAAYIPFSYGPGNCVGKSLALLELRYVIAVLVRRFEFEFEFEAEEGVGGSDDDEFALSPGKLPVVVCVRGGGGDRSAAF
jgi:hypothetical protein